MQILGLDVGEKRIGMAISDKTGKIAMGLGILRRSSFEEDVEAIMQTIVEKRIEKVVVGLPLNMDGSVGQGAQSVLDFARRLEQKIGLPVATQDERLTTAQGERLLIEAGTRRKKRKLVADKLAAQLILQSYLDRTQSADEFKKLKGGRGVSEDRFR